MDRRSLFAIFTGAIMLIIIYMLTIPVLGLKYGIMVGGILWLLSVTQAANFFIVSVPEITGLITINLFIKATSKEPYRNLKTYLTGLSFKFPWEQSKRGNYIDLRIVTQSFEEDFPAQDGPMIEIRGSFQYRADSNLLHKYIAVDETTINQGIRDVITSHLTKTIAITPAVETRKITKELEEGVHGIFKMQDSCKRASDMSTRTDDCHELEELYGIQILVVAIADSGYKEAFQKARATQRVSHTLREAAEKLQKEQGLSSKDAMNAIMVINGDISKNIQEVEGEGGNALASLFMAGANASSKGGK